MGTFQALSENAMGGFPNESPLATQKTAIGGTENQRCGHKSSHNFRISCPNPDFLSDPESPVQGGHFGRLRSTFRLFRQR